MSKHTTKKPKIIVVLGPTASGKSDLCVDLALWLDSEIVSADSRQVFKNMNIGTGKITKKEMRSIPHHLLNVANPKQKFDIVKYKNLAEKAIEKILQKNKVPIICGGTGFYIQSIVDNIAFPEVPADESLRKKLEKYSLDKLLKILDKLDPKILKTIDQKNKRKIIRAIEISKALGSVPKLKSNPKYDALQIGISKDKETLKKLIEKRLQKRLKQGMISEVKKLHANGVSWKKLISFGLEYKFIALYLQGKLTKQEMTEQLNTAIWHYAKRQITWFKRDERINWLNEKNSPSQNKKEAKKLINNFLAS